MSSPITVAICGGTQSVGLHILTALLTHDPPFRVLLLTRLSKDKGLSLVPDSIKAHPNLTVAYSTPYHSIPEIAALFRTHNVHTVLSVISCIDDISQLYTTQRNIYEAAKLTDGVVRRFIPSEWEGTPARRPPQKDKTPSFLDYKSKILSYLYGEISAGNNKNVAVGYFIPGVFMDYYAPKYMVSKEEEGGKGYLPDIGFTFLVDLAKREADVPTWDEENPSDKKEEARVRFTLTLDLARFVATVLAIKDWGSLIPNHPSTETSRLWEFRISGSRISPSEFVALGERIFPGTPFKVSRQSISEIKADAEAVAAARDKGKPDIILEFQKEGILASAEGRFDWENEGAGKDYFPVAGNTVVVDASGAGYTPRWDLETFLRRWDVGAPITQT